MKVFASAAEISSDIHAEKIIAALQKKIIAQGKTFEVIGVGGPRLRSLPSFRAIENAESLRAMGFIEVIGKLPSLKRTLRRLLLEIAEFNPDVIITFDYPDFHMKLLSEVKKAELAPRALKICAIPPKVWVWRSYRVEKIRKLYDGVLVVFPFEKDFYESKRIPVIYEGNPLIAELFNDLNECEEQNVVPLIQPDEFVITVMPGSRDAELKYHLPLIPEVLERFSKGIGKKVRAWIPVPKGVELLAIKEKLVATSQVNYDFIPDGAKFCLKHSSLGLIKSGTSTLESALLGCTPVIFYKTSKITEWIMRYVVRYAGPVGLPNILLGIKKREKAVYPEYLGVEASALALSNELIHFANNPSLMEERKKAGFTLKKSLVPSDHVEDSIADGILKWESRIRTASFERKSKYFILLVSFLWSSVNAMRRFFYSLKVVKAFEVPVPSVLFGNIQAGGSGKTPLLIEFAKFSIQRGKRVAVVTRGYKGKVKSQSEVIERGVSKIDATFFGDEAAEIKHSVPEVILAVGPNRVASISMLMRLKEKPDLILFDDGFQNLTFKPTRTVLCVTDLKPSQIPFRDFHSVKTSADFVLNTKGGGGLDLKWEVSDLPKMPVMLLCALASPEEVVRFYSSYGVRFEKLALKPDHAAFDQESVKKLMKTATSQGLMVVVTQKDYMKLESLGIELYPKPLSEVRLLEENKVGILERKIGNQNVFETILTSLTPSK